MHLGQALTKVKPGKVKREVKFVQKLNLTHPYNEGEQITMEIKFLIPSNFQNLGDLVLGYSFLIHVIYEDVPKESCNTETQYMFSKTWECSGYMNNRG